MTNWKQIALSLDPPIPPEAADKLLPVLEALESTFAPLRRSIPPGTDLWTGPEDAT
jgi:hypothetical protein